MRRRQPSPRIDDVLERLARAARRGERVIVGPWLSEIGFEVLYWIPFLRWVLPKAGVDPAQVLVISRGGCHQWYRDIGRTYIDVFEAYTVAQFSDMNTARIRAQKHVHRDSQKQLAVTAVDELILQLARDRCAQTERPEVLHPSVMYLLFRTAWKNKTPAVIDRCTTYAPFPAINRDGPLAMRHLPESYVAVKFYANGALPASAAAVVREELLHLAESTDIVWLETGMAFDEHTDISVEHPRMHRLLQTMTPRTNLAIQTRVIAGASRLLATYGGFSYLGPSLGVPTETFFADAKGFRRDHLERARRVFRGDGFGSFLVSQVGVPMEKAS